MQEQQLLRKVAAVAGAATLTLILTLILTLTKACFATNLSRILRKYNPFHYVYLSVGARFGSGIHSLSNPNPNPSPNPNP